MDLHPPRSTAISLSPFRPTKSNCYLVVLLTFVLARIQIRPSSRAEGRTLYRRLVEPLEPILGPYRHLIVEPDQALWLIPFEALIDKRGVYLGDRYTISFSPGLDYLASSQPWRNLGKESHILIAGDPETTGKMPLKDAEEEAKGIARQFRYSKLLLQEDAGYRQITKQMEDMEIFHFSGHASASPDGVGLLLGDSQVMNVARIQALGILSAEADGSFRLQYRQWSRGYI